MKSDRALQDSPRSTLVTPNWQAAELARATFHWNSGAMVIMLTHNTDGSGAPIIHLPSGLEVSPDLEVQPRDGLLPFFEDVKAKAVPDVRRNPPGPRWEHGIDYSIAEAYRRAHVETLRPTIVVIQESREPVDPRDVTKGLRPARIGQWLTLSIDDAFLVGEHRPDWPGGKANPANRGRNGKGGLLWAREAMSIEYDARYQRFS